MTDIEIREAINTAKQNLQLTFDSSNGLLNPNMVELYNVITNIQSKCPHNDVVSGFCRICDKYIPEGEN